MEESKTIRLELSTDNSTFRNSFYTELELPAKDYKIRDALHRIRAAGLPGHAISISVLECQILPELTDIRLDTPTIEELNFLSARLGSLDDNQQWILQAVAKQFLHTEEDAPVRMKDLINMTYGLEDVPVIPNVSTDGQLGRFVIVNDMHNDVMAVPEQSLYLLDQQKIGRLQRENDGGVFTGRRYIAAGQYKMPEVYDGEHLPESVSDESFVFSLFISEEPENCAEATADSAEWIRLPINKAEANRIAGLHGERCIEDCVYYAFESTVPQITEEQFGDMLDFDKLNKLAERIEAMSPSEQVKYKAALATEQPEDIAGAVDIAEHISEYELSEASENYEQFFKEYLQHHLDSRFDGEWLDMLLTQNEGRELLERLGASITDYGVLSARGHSLYELVPYREPEVKELAEQSMTDEKLDVIELLDKKALFSNRRITPEEIPEGLYAYDLRHSDEENCFVSIEPKVDVNYGGTILMKERLDFGKSGAIYFTEDSSPNFLSEEMTLEEFVEADMDEDEEIQMGEMQI